MAKINGVDMPNFTPGEFSEDPEKHAHRLLLQNVQGYRTILGAKVFPSLANGALARFDGRKTSMHYIRKYGGITSRSKALDVFCNTHIFKAWTIAQSCNLFNGIGVYFDTDGNNGKPWPMLHLDLRCVPLIWYRHEGQYFYPHKSKTFFQDLQNLFMINRNWQ